MPHKHISKIYRLVNIPPFTDTEKPTRLQPMKKPTKTVLIILPLITLLIAAYPLIFPFPPYSLSATVTDNEHVILKWCEPKIAINLNGYRMFRRLNTDPLNDNAPIPRGTKQGPIYTDNTCTGICIYRVASVAGVGTDSNQSKYVRCNINKKGNTCTYKKNPVPSDPAC